jgi:ABC-type transport system substrate-binding protein
LTTQVGYIISPKMLADPDLATKPIGTGAFRFENHVKNESWKFVRYPSYWRKDADGTQLPYLGSIDFLPIPDGGLRLAGLETGDLDVVMLYSPDEVKRLRDSPQYKVVEYGDGEEDVVTLNTQKAPFDNATARQAMAYATDSEAWRNEVNQGVPRPAVGPFAPGQIGGGDQTGYPGHDPAKAKQLVEQYTAETGQPFAFVYLATGGPLDQAEAQLLERQWEAAGMQVTIEFKEQQALITQVVTGQYQAADWRNFGFPDPDADSVWWLSTSVVDAGVSLNVARFQNPEIDAAIKRSFATTDEKVRDEAYQTVARLLGENVAYLWLGRVNWVIAADERVNGLPGAANGSLSTLGPKTWLTTLWLS